MVQKAYDECYVKILQYRTRRTSNILAGEGRERELSRCGVCVGDHLNRGLQVGAFGARGHKSRQAFRDAYVCVRLGRLL